MGLTVAEAFILLSFVLLLLFAWWQIDTERRSLVSADKIGKMTETQKHEVFSALSDGTFDVAKQLREVGITSLTALSREDAAQFARFIREEDFRQLMNGAIKLDPDTRVKLSEAIELTPETQLRAGLEKLKKFDDPMAEVSTRLATAAADEAAVVQMLNRELGAQIRAAGGEIASDGTITLPQSILFHVNEAEIVNKDFLVKLCVPWIATLKASGLDISEVRIEGHASSEGAPGQTSEEAYLFNLGLSQSRAHNALEVCLKGLDQDPELLEWAQTYLASVGYSSARLIFDENGLENKNLSRRVSFAMDINRDRLIEGIKDDLSISDRRATEKDSGLQSFKIDDGQTSVVSKELKIQTGFADVIDGDTITVGAKRWRIFGIDAPEIKQTCLSSSERRYACGEAARDALIELIGEAEVQCEEYKLDRYGRSVGICRAQGRDLGEELVKIGMAIPYLEYSDRYIEQGKIARRTKIGLWAGKFEPPAVFRKLN
ncbi:MAG: thermonuclease family protein [Rhodobacteraceae bacterium]|nr:thermonuclease family protein [Paracoccaceae bacterium]